MQRIAESDNQHLVLKFDIEHNQAYNDFVSHAKKIGYSTVHPYQVLQAVTNCSLNELDDHTQSTTGVVEGSESPQHNRAVELMSKNANSADGEEDACEITHCNLPSTLEEVINVDELNDEAVNVRPNSKRSWLRKADIIIHEREEEESLQPYKHSAITTHAKLIVREDNHISPPSSHNFKKFRKVGVTL